MDKKRRQLLGAGAALAAAAIVSAGATTDDSETVFPLLPASTPLGSAGQFDFLTGEWQIAHRRLPPGATVWDEFEGEATCWSILGGIGSVEELRIPARGFSGMGLRLLDVAQQRWSDYWVNAKYGVLATPGQSGGFVDGVGIFSADDTDQGTPIKIIGVWDQIRSDHCRWRQGVSRDGGRTWQLNWSMRWRRVT